MPGQSSLSQDGSDSSERKWFWSTLEKLMFCPDTERIFSKARSLSTWKPQTYTRWTSHSCTITYVVGSKYLQETKRSSSHHSICPYAIPKKGTSSLSKIDVVREFAVVDRTPKLPGNTSMPRGKLPAHRLERLDFDTMEKLHEIMMLVIVILNCFIHLEKTMKHRVLPCVISNTFQATLCGLGI